MLKFIFTLFRSFFVRTIRKNSKKKFKKSGFIFKKDNRYKISSTHCILSTFCDIFGTFYNKKVFCDRIQ